MKLPPLMGNGFETVGVALGSALSRISAGGNSRRGRRWSWKRDGLVIARGVRVDMNFGNWDWDREGMVSSIG
jgi:hypothetical protein